MSQVLQVVASVLGLPTTGYPQILCSTQSPPVYQVLPAPPAQLPVLSPVNHATSVNYAVPQRPRLFLAGNKLYMQSGPSKTYTITGKQIPKETPNQINNEVHTPASADLAKLPAGISTIYTKEPSVEHLIQSSLPPEVVDIEPTLKPEHITHVPQSLRPLPNVSLAPFLSSPSAEASSPPFKPSVRPAPIPVDLEGFSFDAPTTDVDVPSLPEDNIINSFSAKPSSQRTRRPVRFLQPRSLDSVPTVASSTVQSRDSLGAEDATTPATIEQQETTQEESFHRSGAIKRVQSALVSLPPAPTRTPPIIFSANQSRNALSLDVLPSESLVSTIAPLHSAPQSVLVLDSLENPKHGSIATTTMAGGEVKLPSEPMTARREDTIPPPATVLLSTAGQEEAKISLPMPSTPNGAEPPSMPSIEVELPSPPLSSPNIPV